MLTDRETELRDAYLKGYEDKTNYSDKLVVDRYELAEGYAVSQAKNHVVLDNVSKPFLCFEEDFCDLKKCEIQCDKCKQYDK